MTDITQGIDFLKNKKGYEKVFIERDSLKLQKYFESPDAEPPIDLLILAVYQGKVCYLVNYLFFYIVSLD